MAEILKRGKSETDRYEADQQVQAVVRGILDDIRLRGDEAVRELSLKFDGWSAGTASG